MKKLAATIDIGQNFWLERGKGISQRYGTFESLGDFISGILPNVLVIAGLIAFFLLIIVGFAYIVEAGQGPEKTKKVSQWFTSILIGLLIIFASYWIIKLVEAISGFSIF